MYCERAIAQVVSVQVWGTWGPRFKSGLPDKTEKYFGGIMVFPLKELVEYRDNVYEITSAASRRVYQLSVTKDVLIEENNGKVVSLAAKQLFTKQVEFRIEQ